MRENNSSMLVPIEGLNAFRKPRILFVGGFAGAQKNGTTGGVLYASMSLLASPISDFVEWRLLNSSLESLPPPPVWIRGCRAAIRLVKFVTMLCTDRIDIVLLFSSAGPSLLEKGIMALLGKLFRKRVIFCPQSGLIKEHFRTRSWLAKFARYVFSRSDQVICQGLSWRRYYEEETKLPSAKFVVVQNWIDAAPYLALPLPPERPVISVLYIGWMVPSKGIFELIEAAQGCAKRYGGRIVFTMVGGGAALTEARERVERSGLSATVRLLGWVTPEEKMRLLTDADIFILPSYAEGMPYALLEAMAAGRACIATDVGGIKDLLTSLNIGRLVEPRSVAPLERALDELAGSHTLRLQLGRAARDHVLQHNEVWKTYPHIYHVFTGRQLPNLGAHVGEAVAS